MIRLIYCCNILGYIGKDGGLLRSVPSDLKRFKELTKGDVVIMGRSTWESLPQESRPLPDRVNVVLTSNTNYVANGAEILGSLRKALVKYKNHNIWIIGGEKVLKSGMLYANEVYATIITDFQIGDAMAPTIPRHIKPVSIDVKTDTDLTIYNIIYRQLDGLYG